MHPILYKLKTSDNKGVLFEKALSAALKSIGFVNIRRQQSGSQFGFDIYAETIEEYGPPAYWYFECKNLGTTVKPYEIAPKLIWHFRKSRISMFVIASLTDLSNEAFELLGNSGFPFPVMFWGKDYILNLLYKSPEAMNILGLNNSEDLPDIPSSQPLSFGLSTPAILDVYHSLEPPYSFHYIQSEAGIIKCYSDFRFILNLTIRNVSNHSINISNIKCRTNNYKSSPRRVLTQMKMKGFYDPVKFNIIPAPTNGKSVSITDSMLKIGKHDFENFQVEIDPNTQSGYYQLEFYASARHSERNYELRSPSFPFYKSSQEDSHLLLYVVSKHYDHMADKILSLSDEVWQSLVAESEKQNQLLYLGPTMHELARFEKNPTWQIKAVLYDRDTGMLDQYHKLIYDLAIPADKEMHYITREQMEQSWKEMGLI